MPPKQGFKAYMRQYRTDAATREKGNRAAIAYLETPRGKAANKAGTMNSRAKALRVEGKLTADDVQSLLSKPECAHPACKADKGLELDHIIPLTCGGTNTLSNLCLLCGPHHKAKSRR